MIEKNKVGLYDSLMTNVCKIDEQWSVTGALTAPKKVCWDYLGGIQDCAISPAKVPDEEYYITVFTDKDLHSPLVNNVKSKYKVAFLHECRQIHPFAYSWILSAEDKFDFIVTHDETLLSRSEKYLKISTGSSWISENKAKIYDKTKLLSHIASNKSWAPGHKLRHIITKAIDGKYDVDFWGSAFKEFEKQDKYLCLKDYYFSITIMNAKNNNYFTETLVDAFRCGTVPIFWGCENLGEYFNEKGILRFTTPQEFRHIMDNLTKEQYYEMLPYIRENFEIAKQHTQLDDLVFDTIMCKIEEQESDK
tara:strand:+ start:1380 stop:2297 length:918 start_codon:yes stop_codon:yes gene_type:complete